MAVTRAIPEATVDAWTAGELLSRRPGLRYWAPSQPSQGRQRTTGRPRTPWDLDVKWPYKPFLLEDKALGFDGKILINPRQRDVLVDLERLGVPVFYGLPLLSPRHLPTPPHATFPTAVELRYRPRFHTWLHVLAPTVVKDLQGTASSLEIGPARNACALRNAAARAAGTLIPCPSIGAFLRDLNACTRVQRVEPHQTPGWYEGLDGVLHESAAASNVASGLRLVVMPVD